MPSQAIRDSDDVRLVEQHHGLQGSRGASSLPHGGGPGEGSAGSQGQGESAIPIESVVSVSSEAQHPAHAGSRVTHSMRAIKKAALAGEPATARIEEGEGQRTSANGEDHYSCPPTHRENIALGGASDELRAAPRGPPSYVATSALHLLLVSLTRPDLSVENV